MPALHVFLVASLFIYSAVLGDNHVSINVNQISPNGAPMAVSLGANCESAHIADAIGLRKAAFPLDWIVSGNIEKLIELLDKDFLHVLHESFLIPNELTSGLLHTYYHLEFVHEGDFRGNNYRKNIEIFKTKYRRRVERFKNLASYRGKVYFIRIPDINAMNERVRYYPCIDNLEVTDTDAIRLYEALKRRFPHLDFTLVIVNYWEYDNFEFEGKIYDDLLLVKINPAMNREVKFAMCKHFFDRIMAEDDGPSMRRWRKRNSH